MKSFRLALVTGASSGLGAALCKALSERHIPLLLVARNEKKLQEMAQQCAVPCQIYTTDLTCVQDRQKFLSWLVEKGPDLIINNAGSGLYGQAWTHPTSQQSEQVELNVQALLEITLESARELIKQKRDGTIINISSAAAFFPYPTHCIYAATKAFVNQFSEGLDYELKPFGIRILTSCPGQIDTEFSFRASGGVYHRKRRFLTLSAKKTAECILKQVDKGKTIEIIDWRYKCLVALGCFLPKAIQMAILNKSLKRH